MPVLVRPARYVAGGRTLAPLKADDLFYPELIEAGIVARLDMTRALAEAGVDQKLFKHFVRVAFDRIPFHPGVWPHALTVLATSVNACEEWFKKTSECRFGRSSLAPFSPAHLPAALGRAAVQRAGGRGLGGAGRAGPVRRAARDVGAGAERSAGRTRLPAALPRHVRAPVCAAPAPEGGQGGWG